LLIEGLDPARTVVMMCGPGAMVSAVADALFDIGLPMENVVYEQFDYAAASTARKDRLHAAQYASLGAALGLAALIFAFL
jgi:ferredoxin-NADP reductase